MTTLPALLDKDPTQLGFPPTLPLELAAKTGTVQEICASYGIDREHWEELRYNPIFQRACEEALRIVNEDGGAFKVKIKTMAEMGLKKAWELIEHQDLDRVPAAVRADLIKFAVRASGLDASIEQKANAAGKSMIAPLQIIMNLR